MRSLHHTWKNVLLFHLYRYTAIVTCVRSATHLLACTHARSCGADQECSHNAVLDRSDILYSNMFYALIKAVLHNADLRRITLSFENEIQLALGHSRDDAGAIASTYDCTDLAVNVRGFSHVNEKETSERRSYSACGVGRRRGESERAA